MSARDPAGARQGEPAKTSAPILRQFVIETFAYDGGRQVTVYVPPDPPEAIVFAGDGRRIVKWGRLLEKARRWADALRAAHADVVMYERSGPTVAHSGGKSSRAW